MNSNAVWIVLVFNSSSSITITISMFEAQRWSKFISAYSSMLSPAWLEGRGRSLKQLLTSRSQS